MGDTTETRHDRHTTKPQMKDFAQLVQETKLLINSGNAIKQQLKTSSLPSLSSQLNTLNLKIQDNLNKLEALLSNREDSNMNCKLWEKELLSLNSSFLRMQSKENHVSFDELRIPPVDSDQVQSHVMDLQDIQLDSLMSTISRQKEIGSMINNQLDLHIEILDETDEMIDNVGNRLRGNNRMLDTFTRKENGKRNTVVLVVLLVVLLIVILLAKKL